MEKSFETSPTTEKLDTALAKAQGAFSVAVKDSVNPFFKSKYADLASIYESCRLALSKNEICITQWQVDQQDDRMHMITRISHQGEWIMARMAIPVGKQDPQGYKSAATYARRMALVAALGISEEDDDGNLATQNVQRQQTQGRPPMGPPPRTTQSMTTGMRPPPQKNTSQQDDIPF